jgi:hypothetical protein
MGWTCADDCSYHCMWRVSSARQARGLAVLQYHGKWPFFRIFGLQEPAAALFSLGNGVANAMGTQYCWRRAGLVRGGWAFRVLGLVSVNAWAWATVFHCRDLQWTAHADYLSATLLVGVGALAASVQLVRDVRERAAPWLTAGLTVVAAAAYAQHVRSMLDHFDFGHHLRLNIGLGILQFLLWLIWWVRARHLRPHAWRAPALHMLLAALLPLELLDQPPVWGVLDGHALWHAGTIVPAVLFWRTFVAAELRWHGDGNISDRGAKEEG